MTTEVLGLRECPRHGVSRGAAKAVAGSAGPELATSSLHRPTIRSAPRGAGDRTARRNAAWSGRVRLSRPVAIRIRPETPPPLVAPARTATVADAAGTCGTARRHHRG